MIKILIFTATALAALLIFLRGRYRKSEIVPNEKQKDEEQEAKYVEYVSHIIDGNYKSVVPEVAEASKKAFQEWQMFQKKMFRDASRQRLQLRNKYINENKCRDFTPDITDKLKENQLFGYVPFIENAFTEPFPPLHDMDDWAVDTQVADIMILNGITPEESRNFCIHIKNHFVNHSMPIGIIQFDVYKKVA